MLTWVASNNIYAPQQSLSAIPHLNLAVMTPEVNHRRWYIHLIIWIQHFMACQRAWRWYCKNGSWCGMSWWPTVMGGWLGNARAVQSPKQKRMWKDELQKLNRWGKRTLSDDVIAQAQEPMMTEPVSDWCCMYHALSLQEDFTTEKLMLQHYIENQGHICMFLPKFHCELNLIEMLWGYVCQVPWVLNELLFPLLWFTHKPQRISEYLWWQIHNCKKTCAEMSRFVQYIVLLQPAFGFFIFWK